MATEHTTKPAKHKEPSAKITIDALAAMFGLPSQESIDEMNLDYYAECADARREFLDEHTDATEEEIEESGFEAERAAQDDVYRKWHGGILRAAESLFEAHGLELEACVLPKSAPSNALPYEFRIVPLTTWQDAAEKIRETVNGMGPFWFSSVAEFIATTDGTARRTVLSHLGWIKHYPVVYGTRSASALYEGAWS